MKTANKYLINIIFIALGMILISQSYRLGYEGDFNFTLFWLGILFGVIPLLIMTLKNNNNGNLFNNKMILGDNEILVLLFLLGLLFYMPTFFWSPTYFRFNDEILHLNSLEMILEKGNLNINPVHEISKYYPGLEVLTIFFMKFTGLQPFVAGKVLIAIIHSLILIFIYLAFKAITKSQKIALLGSIIFVADPGYIFFDAIFSYETVGILLITILIYVLYMYELSDNKKFSINLILVIVLFALVVTHHFSSFMFFILMILINIAYRLYSSDLEKIKYITRYTILTSLMIVGWILFYAQPTLRYFGNMINLSFLSIFSFLNQGSVQREPFRLTTLPDYELFIDKYIFIPVLFILFLAYIYSIKNDIKKDGNFRNIPMVLFGSLFFLSLPLIFTMAGKLFMYRSWAFYFIGLSFSIAMSLEFLFNKINLEMRIIKIGIFISVILMIMGGVSVGSSSSYRDPKYLDASVPSSITLDVVYGSNWYEKNFGNRNIILGDSTINFVYRGYGNQFVISDPYLFYKDIIDPEFIHYLFMEFKGKFIVVDNRITEKLSATRFYFNDNEPKIDNGYGYKSTLPKKNIEKFDTYIGLYRIYDNGNINIFRIGSLYGAIK